MTEKLPDATIRLSRGLQVLAADIDRMINDAAGERQPFTLLVFTPGRASYASNCSIEDSIYGLRKTLASLESGAIQPAHVLIN